MMGYETNLVSCTCTVLPTRGWGIVLETACIVDMDDTGGGPDMAWRVRLGGGCI